MRKDAEQHASDDQSKREAAETKNRSDATVYETEKFLKEHGAKVSADKKSKAENAVSQLKDAIKSGDVSRMKSALESVNTEMQALSQELYSQAKSARGGASGGAEAGAGAGGGASPGPGAGPAQGGPQGDVIDADFEMVDDDKKKKE